MALGSAGANNKEDSYMSRLLVVVDMQKDFVADPWGVRKPRPLSLM